MFTYRLESNVVPQGQVAPHVKSVHINWLKSRVVHLVLKLFLLVLILHHVLINSDDNHNGGTRSSSMGFSQIGPSIFCCTECSSYNRTEQWCSGWMCVQIGAYALKNGSPDLGSVVQL